MMPIYTRPAVHEFGRNRVLETLLGTALGQYILSFEISDSLASGNTSDVFEISGFQGTVVSAGFISSRSLVGPELIAVTISNHDTSEFSDITLAAGDTAGETGSVISQGSSNVFQIVVSAANLQSSLSYSLIITAKDTRSCEIAGELVQVVEDNTPVNELLAAEIACAF